jgi:hypothetical protein
MRVIRIIRVIRVIRVIRLIGVMRTVYLDFFLCCGLELSDQ